METKAAVGLECPSCDEHAVSFSEVSESFDYGVGEDRVTLSVQVPRGTCAACGFSFTDARAEVLRHEAICEHLGVMKPREVAAVRKECGLSRSDFVSLTKIGAASLSRWERGVGVQNAAMDQYLYLLTFGENLLRLKARGRVASPCQSAGVHTPSVYHFPHVPNVREKEREARAFKLRHAGT